MFVSGLSPEQLNKAAEQAGVVIRPARAVGGILIRLDHDIPKHIRPWILRSKWSNRVCGVCWHGYYAFCAAVFLANEHASIRSALASWESKEIFHLTVNNTPAWNPAARCSCDAEEWLAMCEGRWYERRKEVRA